VSLARRAQPAAPWMASAAACGSPTSAYLGQCASQPRVPGPSPVSAAARRVLPIRVVALYPRARLAPRGARRLRAPMPRARSCHQTTSTALGPVFLRGEGPRTARARLVPRPQIARHRSVRTLLQGLVHGRDAPVLLAAAEAVAHVAPCHPLRLRAHAPLPAAECHGTPAHRHPALARAPIAHPLPFGAAAADRCARCGAVTLPAAGCPQYLQCAGQRPLIARCHSLLLVAAALADHPHRAEHGAGRTR
jgi:hypothetical protein